MGKIICVVSGKGGTGKTTVTANIAAALSLMDKDTLVIDADLGLRNMDLALGLQDFVVYDILDVSSGNCKTREAIIKATRYPHLYFLPASQFKEFNTISKEEIDIVIDKVQEKYDYILIDCPAGLGENVCSVASVSDMAVIVVNPDPFSLRDADRVADLVSQYGVENVKMVVNRFRPNLIKEKKMFNIMQIIEEVAVELIGAIPDDEDVLLSVLAGKPVTFSEDSEVALCFHNTAKRLMGHRIPIAEIDMKKRRFFKRKKQNIYQ